MNQDTENEVSVPRENAADSRANNVAGDALNRATDDVRDDAANVRSVGRNAGQNLAGQPVVGEGVFHNGGHNPFGSSGARGFGNAPLRPMAAPVADNEEENFDWRSIFGILRRRKKIALAVFLSTVGLGMLLTWMTRPIYNASSTMLFSQPSNSPNFSIATDAMPLLSNLMGGSKASSRSTQLAILQGSSTVEGAMKRLRKTDPASVKDLQKFRIVSADAMGDTDLVAVSVRSYSAQASAAFANALCEQFIAQNENQSDRQATKATAYLKNRLGVVQKELNAKRLAFKKFQEANQTVDPTEEAKLRITQYGQIQAVIGQLEADRASDVAELSAVRSMTERMAPLQTRPAGITRRPVVEDLKKNLTAIELERLKTAQEYAPGSDELRQLDTQIKDIKARLATEAQTEIAGWSTSPNPVRETGLQQIAILQAKVWAQESRARALKDAAAQASARLKELPDKQYRLGELTTDLQTLQATYQLLNAKYIAMRLREQTNASNAEIKERAAPNFRPVSPRKGTNLLLSVLVGLVLAAATAAMLDNADDRVHSQQEAEQASGLSILAQIPFIKDKSKQTLLENAGGSSVLLESYRMLRTNIEFATLGKPLRSIAVTSTQPNEGKSTTSMDLAIVMALDGRKVILLDADLRRPSLHTFFDLSNRIGFTSLVAGTSTLEEALQNTPIPNLFLLASGPVPPNPPELLNSKAARAVFSKLGEECDLLVCDTPPALVITDAQIVASMTDAALLVVSMQEAGKREIGRTSQALAHTGTQVLGAVLNKATAESMGYGSFRNYQKQYYGDYVNS